LTNGTTNIDGLDFVSNIEQLLFLNNDPNGLVLFDLAYNGVTPSLTSGGHTVLDSSVLYTLPDEDHRVTGNVDRTAFPGPVASRPSKRRLAGVSRRTSRTMVSTSWGRLGSVTGLSNATP
jgi:hypothetical protein